jgi:hypothetical protein
MGAMEILQQLSCTSGMMSRAAMQLTLKKCFVIWFAGLFLSHMLFGQSAPPATQPTMFHIAGKITISNNFSAFAVTFKGESSKTVEANEAGVYKADLPLGLWTMTVQQYTAAGKTDMTLLSYDAADC